MKCSRRWLIGNSQKQQWRGRSIIRDGEIPPFLFTVLRYFGTAHPVEPFIQFAYLQQHTNILPPSHKAMDGKQVCKVTNVLES